MQKRQDKTTRINSSYQRSSSQNRSFSRDSYVNSSRVNPAVSGASAGRTDSARYSELRKKRKRGKRIKIALVSILCVLVLGVGAAGAYVWYLNSKITGDVDQSLLDALAVTESSDPFYMLLMGVDKSEARDASGEFGDTYRCDTIILCRVDPKNKIAALVSLPRDLQIVNMGGTTEDPIGYGTAKLNAAYAYGGPALMVETVSQIAGVPISHYVECDFDGFEAAVDAVGGVEINVAMEIDDSNTGVYVPAGEQTLNGAQALSLCRSRHTYDYVGDGDALRTAYQRQVLQALAAKLLSSDIGTIFNTVNTLVNYITTDMDVSTIIGYANLMQGMSTDSIYTASMPKTSKYVNELWYDFVYQDEWEEMMQRMDQGLPPSAEAEVDEATGIVISSGGDTGLNENGNATSPAHSTASISIRNGTEQSGIASAALEKLKTFGYSNVEAGNANDSDYQNTLVIYAESTYESDAEIIAQQLGCGTVMVNDGNYLMSGNLLVILGSDYHSES